MELFRTMIKTGAATKVMMVMMKIAMKSGLISWNKFNPTRVMTNGARTNARTARVLYVTLSLSSMSLLLLDILAIYIAPKRVKAIISCRPKPIVE